jgi:hypothetical protein
MARGGVQGGVCKEEEAVDGDGTLWLPAEVGPCGHDVSHGGAHGDLLARPLSSRFLD